MFDEYHANWKPRLQFSELILIAEGEGYISDFSDKKIDSYLLSGYDVLFLLTPSRDFNDYEKEAVRDFVEKGGSLIIFGESGDSMKSEGILTPINSISTMFGKKFNSN